MKTVRAIVLGAAFLSLSSIAVEAAPNEITITLSPEEWTILINSAQTSTSEIIAKIQAQYREQAAAKMKVAHTPVAHPPVTRLPPPHPPAVLQKPSGHPER